MKDVVCQIGTMTNIRKELYEFYKYLYVDELECGRTRYDLFSHDEVDSLDSHEELMMVIMDMEEAERQLSSAKRKYESQLKKKR